MPIAYIWRLPYKIKDIFLKFAGGVTDKIKDVSLKFAGGKLYYLIHNSVSNVSQIF